MALALAILSSLAKMPLEPGQTPRPIKVMSDVSGLDMSDLGAILEWRKFYRDHVNYTFVGVLKGRYFDADGGPTSMKEELDQKEIAKDQSDKLKENLRSRWKSCNSHS